MRFRLRTLLIILAVAPPLIGWWAWPAIKERYEMWQWQRTAKIPGLPTGQWMGGYLGAFVDDNSDAKGVEVIEVRPGTPAEAGGLRKGDVITGFNDFICRDLSDFDSVQAGMPTGTRVSILVKRDGKTKKLEVTLGTRPVPR